MAAPIRAIATAPLYKAGQMYLQAKPNQLGAVGYGVRNALVPSAASNSLAPRR
jgi:hypothetical protein